MNIRQDTCESYNAKAVIAILFVKLKGASGIFAAKMKTTFEKEVL